MATAHVVVIGGTGLFGRHIVDALARDGTLTVTVAGRRLPAAQALVHASQPTSAAALHTAALDVEGAGFAEALAALRPDIVIHAAGPFQQRDYAVARAALAAGAHCIDLADGRAFVTGIDALDADARAAGRWVISGASSVPGLSAAVVAAHRPRFARLDAIDTAISPGNRTERGLATTQAILGYVGKPFTQLRDGHLTCVHGWTSMRRLRVAGVGTRWLARCDVPDLAVLPARHGDVYSCDFRAGLELRRMHFGLWLLATAVRARLVRDPVRWARPLLALSNQWARQGSDIGVMRMDLTGIGLDGRPLHLRWTLIARDGDGPRVPAMPSALLARKLAAGALPGAGARACLDLFTLDECMAALMPWAIESGTDIAGPDTQRLSR